jgi:uncharacterized protein
MRPLTAIAALTVDERRAAALLPFYFSRKRHLELFRQKGLAECLLACGRLLESTSELVLSRTIPLRSWQPWHAWQSFAMEGSNNRLPVGCCISQRETGGAMGLGLSTKLNILQQSPHDFAAPPDLAVAASVPAKIRWLPSRYNIRASAEDGRLVLWNSYSGAMSVFEPEKVEAIKVLISQKGFEAPEKGIVKYLHKRGFLIKEGTNEYRRIQAGFGHQHYRTDTLQLILLSSEDCNFRCQYCYEDFARGTMLPWVRDAIKKLVERRLPTLRNLSISWFGGEPLYGLAAIEDLAPFFIKTAEENSLNFSSHMTTNGYLLTPETAQNLLSWGIRRFQITIDGAPEDHDRSRPARDGSGTFETIFANLLSMKARDDKFSISIRVNFDQRNYVRLQGFLDLLKTEFANDDRFQLMFRAVGKWGGANDGNLEVCGTKEATDVQREMKAEAMKRGLKLADDIRAVNGLSTQVCYAARPYNFIVGADGKLMKCTIDLDKHDRNIVGTLKTDGELDLDLDKFAMWTEPAFERDSQCQKCVVLPACQGTYCPQIRIETNLSPCTPLRRGAKADLLQALESMNAGDRKISVSSPEPAAQS